MSEARGSEGHEPGRPGAAREPLSSRSHPLIQRIRKLSRRPQLGPRTGLFLLDGVHLLEEALASSYEPEVILVSPRLRRTEGGSHLQARMEERAWPLREVGETLLGSLATTKTAQGVLGLFRRGPAADLCGPEAAPLGRLAALVLAGVQDPLNLGALARAAHVFGCPRLITLADTVDPLHPRALRASAGSLLHLTICGPIGEAALGDWIRRHRIRAVALVPRGGVAIAQAPPSPDPRALVLGSEGRGLPAGVAALCAEHWSIPMAEEADSLGVAAAGAIALFAASQQPA